MDILPVPTASQKFAELLRSAASTCPEYAVWAAVLESPLSDASRSEIESLLSDAFEEGMESLTGDRMAGIMSRLAEILERERQELIADRRDAESLLLRFFATSA